MCGRSGVSFLVESNQWLTNGCLSLPKQDDVTEWDIRSCYWQLDLHVRQHYNVAMRAHCHKLVPVLSPLLPECQTTNWSTLHCIPLPFQRDLTQPATDLIIPSCHFSMTSCRDNWPNSPTSSFSAWPHAETTDLILPPCPFQRDLKWQETDLILPSCSLSRATSGGRRQSSTRGSSAPRCWRWVRWQRSPPASSSASAVRNGASVARRSATTSRDNTSASTRCPPWSTLTMNCRTTRTSWTVWQSSDLRRRHFAPEVSKWSCLRPISAGSGCCWCYCSHHSWLTVSCRRQEVLTAWLDSGMFGLPHRCFEVIVERMGLQFLCHQAERVWPSVCSQGMGCCWYWQYCWHTWVITMVVGRLVHSSVCQLNPWWYGFVVTDTHKPTEWMNIDVLVVGIYSVDDISIDNDQQGDSTLYFVNPWWCRFIITDEHIGWLNIATVIVGIVSIGDSSVDDNRQVGPMLYFVNSWWCCLIVTDMHIEWPNIDTLVIGIVSIGSNSVDNNQKVGPML